VEEHDFLKFYSAESHFRHALKYPPFVRLAVVLFRHKDNERVRGVASDFAALLRAARAPMTIYGPTPAPLARINNEFRWHLLIKSDAVQDPAARIMRQTLARVAQFSRTTQPAQRVRVTIDIDPVAIL
jgi:primosomal protein N' (replication factor Y)